MSGVLELWRDGALEAVDWCDPARTEVLVADSWLVADGRVRGLDIHRSRFLAGVAGVDDGPGEAEAARFWDAAVAALPRTGAAFPRVELQRSRGAARLALRMRDAPERLDAVVLATAADDPRRHPSVKGPDLERLSALRQTAQSRGAQEAVIVDAAGAVIEGAYSSLVWWRGEVLCRVPADVPRIASVTERSLVAVATALGVEVHDEAAAPAELDGCEIWALSALHGVRMVTGWVDGPSVAELPGRWRTWRDRLDALRRPLPAA